nr:putative late blight resistance protein homolog R1B-16 isoform X2 [Ipomoea trifida]
MVIDHSCLETCPMVDHSCLEPCPMEGPSVMEPIPHGSEILQTLDLETTLSITDTHLLRKLPGLKYLRCGVSKLYPFAEIEFLHHLESLTLFTRGVGNSHLLNDLKLTKFPSNVKEIHFAWITLSSSAISIIAQLSKLETLTLWSCLFDEGLEWNVDEETQFCKLKYLKLCVLSGIRFWIVSNAVESFPCLEQLILDGCYELEGLSYSFADISTLKLISVVNCPCSVNSSVKEIQEELQNMGSEQLTVHIGKFSINSKCSSSDRSKFMHTYHTKDLMNKIYSQVCGSEITMRSSVAEELRKRLMGMRYLIVLDDIWSVEAWEELNRVFPECDNGSRIVLTSRQESVVSDTKHICLPFFTIDESWELLQVKLFKGKGCPKELENVGRQISNKCKGLPLTIGLIAGLLEKVEKSEQMWREFLLTLNSHVSFGDGIKSNDAIELSYKYLSRPLKSCLLYFAAFPEDKEIEVSKLIELWICEGFIEGMVETERVEDEAEDYLNHLVSSNLVMMSRKLIDGQIESCGVHDLVHDFCLTKAREETFLEEKSRSIMTEAILVCSKEFQTWHWQCPLTPNHERLLRELPCLRTLICDVSSSESFPKIDFLHHLEKLKLFCNERQHLLNDLKLSKFPPSIKEIHLTRIILSASAILTIAQLPNLETLSLVSCPFEEGLTWNVGEETKFQNLKRLQLFLLDIGIWNISSAAESFPCLEQLTLALCRRFKEMPYGFEDVLTLKMISAEDCNPTVYSWVKEIEECARDLGNEQLQIDIIDGK